MFVKGTLNELRVNKWSGNHSGKWASAISTTAETSPPFPVGRRRALSREVSGRLGSDGWGTSQSQAYGSETMAVRSSSRRQLLETPSSLLAEATLSNSQIPIRKWKPLERKFFFPSRTRKKGEEEGTHWLWQEEGRGLWNLKGPVNIPLASSITAVHSLLRGGWILRMNEPHSQHKTSHVCPYFLSRNRNTLQARIPSRQFYWGYSLEKNCTKKCTCQSNHWTCSDIEDSRADGSMGTTWQWSHKEGTRLLLCSKRCELLGIIGSNPSSALFPQPHSYSTPTVDYIVPFTRLLNLHHRESGVIY